MSETKGEESKIVEVKMNVDEIKEVYHMFTSSHGFLEKEGISLPYFHSERSTLKDEYETKHDVPCPNVTGTDVANNREVNEWVLNHLPLKEDEKKQLIADLQKDVVIQKRSEKGKLMKKKKKTRIPKKSKDSGHRPSVKDS